MNDKPTMNMNNHREQEQLIKTTSTRKSYSTLAGRLIKSALDSNRKQQVSQLVAYVSLVAVLLALVVTPTSGLHSSDSSSSSSSSSPNQLETAGGGGGGNSNLQTQHQQQQQKAALEAELNSILQQHEAHEQDNKLLSEAIISRLMLGNLSEPNTINEVDASEPEESQAADLSEMSSQEQSTNEQQEQQLFANLASDRLRKLVETLHSVEMSSPMAQMGSNPNGMNNGQAFSQFPVLPASQAATIKRASMKMNNLLRQHQQQRMMNYGRPQYDFGLGKRPDSSISSNVLRLGDSSIGSGVQSVSGQLSKRPAHHRYDFGLGKRVASPAYPRYDFGLGKRAPNRIRYDFGLGK